MELAPPKREKVCNVVIVRHVSDIGNVRLIHDSASQTIDQRNCGIIIVKIHCDSILSAGFVPDGHSRTTLVSNVRKVRNLTAW